VYFSSLQLTKLASPSAMFVGCRLCECCVTEQVAGDTNCSHFRYFTCLQKTNLGYVLYQYYADYYLSQLTNGDWTTISSLCMYVSLLFSYNNFTCYADIAEYVSQLVPLYAAFLMQLQGGPKVVHFSTHPCLWDISSWVMRFSPRCSLYISSFSIEQFCC